MIVTDKNLVLDSMLVSKLDLMVERVVKHKFDNLIIVDGKEGYGKSNLTSAMSYYCAYQSKRDFSMKNVFFLIDDMVKFAVETEKQVIWWDEAALGGLASESYNKMQVKLLKLLYVARKKQHFYFFVIPKYFKLREGIIDRAIGLVHTYSIDEVSRGRFSYYKSDMLEKMYSNWRKSRDKGYKKHYTFLGKFSETLPKVIDEVEYDKKKDEAILSIAKIGEGENKATKNLRTKLEQLRLAYSTLDRYDSKELAKHCGTTKDTVARWRHIKKINSEIEFPDEKTELLSLCSEDEDKSGNYQTTNEEVLNAV